jgi:hypothetical protein
MLLSFAASATRVRTAPACCVERGAVLPDRALAQCVMALPIGRRVEPPGFPGNPVSAVLEYPDKPGRPLAPVLSDTGADFDNHSLLPRGVFRSTITITTAAIARMVQNKIISI